MPGELRVEIEPAGYEPDAVKRQQERVIDHPQMREFLGDAQFRLLNLRPLDDDAKASEGRDPARFQATGYDYTNDRTVEVLGHWDGPDDLEISAHTQQPLPSSEEFEAAVRILSEDPGWRDALEGHIPYPHIPPIVSGGQTRRAIGVALAPRDRESRLQAVAVDLLGQQVHELRTRAGGGLCGVPPSFQAPYTGGAGQAWVSVWEGETRLWRMLVVRPAASSGTNGSGIELRHVDYRDQRILGQAHVPMVNVCYDEGGCGSYLDWVNHESPFQAEGTDEAPGFRLCSSQPKTVFESGSDHGTFVGVAVYVAGPEVVLTTELAAGWYRYQCSWHLDRDGTIRPRFGFTAVDNPCVCNRHHHHCYWRFDFDVHAADGNVVSEFNDPPLAGQPGSWHEITTEVPRPREYARKRRWRITHPAAARAYEIVPGAEDGVATAMPDWPFPRGDLWFARYRPSSEFDTGVTAAIGDAGPHEADIEQFLTGEDINGQDVVVWYGAHASHEPHLHHNHFIGPDLVPVDD